MQDRGDAMRRGKSVLVAQELTLGCFPARSAGFIKQGGKRQQTQSAT